MNERERDSERQRERERRGVREIEVVKESERETKREGHIHTVVSTFNSERLEQ